MAGNRWKNIAPWDRLMAKTKVGPLWTDGTRCWVFTGSKTKAGYGTLYLNGRSRQVHQVAWELSNGRPMPAGTEIDHLCKHPWCVNPLHLEPVTRRENILRSSNLAAQRAKQTHCKRGHEFTHTNTYISARRERVCRKCRAAREYARRHGLDFEAYVASRSL